MRNINTVLNDMAKQMGISEAAFFVTLTTDAIKVVSLVLQTVVAYENRGIAHADFVNLSVLCG